MIGNIIRQVQSEPIPVAVGIKVCVCSRYHPAIPGSNCAGVMDVCPL